MKPIHVDEIPDEILNYVGTIKDTWFPRQGHTSDVGIIDTENGKYILKRTKGKQFCSWLYHEAFILTCLSKTSLPVPALHKFVEQETENQSWTLTQFLEGETLRSALFNEKDKEKRYEMLFGFGKVLAQVHATPCPKELIKDSMWLDEMLEAAEYNLINYKVDGTSELLEVLKKNRPNPINQTLIHGDFTIDNVLVHKGNISGIIDWSGGAFGDPRYDVSLAVRSKPHIFETEVEQHIFFEGYGEKIIDEKEYNYFEDGLYQFF